MAVITVPTNPPLDRETVERLGVRRNEPQWLIESRLAALARYTPESWPTGQEEEWRRFKLDALPPLALSSDPDGENPPSEYGSVPVDAARRGVVFDRWIDAVRDHPELVKRWLGDGGGIASHDAFRAISGAAFGHGSTFLYVPAGVDVELPLAVHKHWAADGTAIVFRTVVVAEENSSVTFVEELSSGSGGSPRLAVGSLEVHLGQGARVRYVGIQRFADDVWNIGTQRYLSGQDSSLASFNVMVGGNRSKIGIESDMHSDGAEVKLYGLVAATGEQVLDVNSFQRLDGKGGTSDLLYLSALYEAARAVYYGVIRVEPTSSGSGSYQECRNMLLSDRASAHPIPVLEILTNDVVRCGHGATAGALDEADLFYIMSRGLTKSAAEQLLVRGFFQRVINEIPDVQVRSLVLAALEPRIGRAPDLEEVA